MNTTYTLAYTGSEIDNKLNNTYTKTEIDSNIYTKTQIDSNIYTKTQIDTNIYTKTQINNLLNALSKLKLFENVSIATSAWSSDDTYENYPYVATATASGVTSNYYPEVIFNVDDALSGYFAPVCESTSNGVKIWASDIPSSTITIATIKCISM